MNKYKINYYLDKSDRIEVDGHTLSRLYLSQKQSISHRDIASSQLAIFGKDNTDKKMGGYVESLKNIPRNQTTLDTISWVDENSKVYGKSRIRNGSLICNSTIVDSEVKPKSVISDSVVTDSEVCSVFNSTVVDSRCDETVGNSKVHNSTIEIDIRNSTVRNSHISSTLFFEIVVNANLDNVQHCGSLSGTFSDISSGDITKHRMGVVAESGRVNRFNLLQDTKGNFALHQHAIRAVRLGDTVVEQGDIDFDELYNLLNRKLNGRTIGDESTLVTLNEIKESMVLTDSDLDFGDELER